MIKPEVKETKVVFGPCRLSYTHLFQKYVSTGANGQPAGEGKYMTNILIPKAETETLRAIGKAMEKAKQNAVAQKWQGKEPRKLDMALRDGDEKEDPDVFEGHMYLNAKSSTRPGIVDRQLNPITDEEEVYSGMWAIVSVSFYGYDVSGNKGIACGLNNIMKWKDDDHLGGRTSASSDFGDLNLPADDGDDDDDL